jgi:hypothetical protein
MRGCSTVRATQVGLAVAGPLLLDWITIAPGAATTVLDLSDDIESGTTIWTWQDQSGDGVHILFGDRPMVFAKGIYIETLTDIDAVTFGYNLQS